MRSVDPSPAGVNRRYDGSARRDRARATRRRVLEAARDAFLADGYAATTVAGVARRAEVSADLVYKSFGTKMGLLKEVLDVTVGGDDEQVAVTDRPEPQRMRREPDQRRQLAMLAHGVTGNLERLRPIDAILRGAAAVDPEAAALRADIQVRQRRAAMREVVGWVAAQGPLRAGVTVVTGADAVWAVASPEVHEMLRGTCGWSAARYEAWLRDTLTDALLGPTGGDGAG